MASRVGFSACALSRYYAPLEFSGVDTRLMSELPPRAVALPAIVSLQDNLATEGGFAPELDNLRERWLLELLPDRSSFEDLQLVYPVLNLH